MGAMRRTCNQSPTTCNDGPPRLDRQTLWQGSGVELVLTHWTPERHPTASSDESVFSVIELMLSGTFRMRCGRGDARGDLNTAVYFNSGEDYEISHPVAVPNSGLTIRIDDASAARWCPQSRRESIRFSEPESRVAAPTAVGARRLAHALLGQEEPEALAVEESIVSLIGGCVPRTGCERSLVSTSALNRVGIARDVLNQSYGAKVNLSQVAAVAGCSTWQLTREFTQVVGMRMHQYLTRLRLRAALAAMSEGSELTAVALTVGFSSHSHFSAAFKREFGVPPRNVRAALTGTFLPKTPRNPDRGHPGPR